RLPELCRRNLGPGRGRHPARARWASLGERRDVIVAGDIGGTNARLGLFDVRSDVPALVAERVYASPQFPGLESIVRAFIEELRPVARAAAFGLAGPVKDGRVRTPNLPWEVDARALESVLGIGHVVLMNDLEALACGLPSLLPTDIVLLN